LSDFENEEISVYNTLQRCGAVAVRLRLLFSIYLKPVLYV